MEYIIRFSVNLFDLGIFWYYLNSLKKMKRVPKILFTIYLVIMAVVWSIINTLNNPFFNLMALIGILSMIAMFFESTIWSRAVNIVVFVGAGIIVEPVGLILLRALKYGAISEEDYKYYFVVVICAFIRGNVLYLLSKALSKKKVRLSKVPKEIVRVLALTFGFSILNCCFVIVLSMEIGSSRSLIMCVSIIISIVLTYYFMLYMMERFNYLARKRHEDEMYRKEMYYKEQYYSEVDRRHEYVHNLKHDMKNKLIELHYLVEKGDIQRATEQLTVYCDELEKIDENNYCNNPIVDSVLRIKLGVAKSDKIKIDADIRIPKVMQLEHGDIGVLYGNLLDNAIEACRKVESDKRFIRIENKFTEGKLLLIVENSKTGERNESLKTTKRDNYSHGRGIHSVRKVVEKYNGTVTFTDKGDIFEVSVILYGIEAKK
ncbi:MAG: GHKL domain-containing protein [Lachnospiraceae bacterium]|nr:GHKL domain-containing protein [Lachnospiraceae bacterium]MBQ6993355.1 GHKL domain-containing protein [Lachnospiraceae bacterium]